MAKFKTTNKLTSNKKNIVILASSITALTAVGIGVYFLTTKSKAKSTNTGQTSKPTTTNQTFELQNVSSEPTDMSDMIDLVRYSSPLIDPPPTEWRETPTENTTENTTENSTTDEDEVKETVDDLPEKLISTLKTLNRAYGEYEKNVRDPRRGTILDDDGILYDCDYRKIGTFPEGKRIFTYLRKGVGNYQGYYTNPGKGSCGVYEYQWCGAFVAYCWIDVKPELRKKFFPSVTRLMSWVEEDDRRKVKKSEIRPGDILLIAKDGEDKGHHIALCYEDEGYGVFTTIEGNTSGDGQLEGVCVRTRYLKNSKHRGGEEDFIIEAIRPLSFDLTTES